MVNKAFLLGRLGKDPETRYMANGTAVCNFTVATSERWKDKDTGESRERTEWHAVACFGRLAEICGEYLTKGSQVFVEGRLQTSSWEKDGITRYKTEIVASEMKMLGQRKTTHEPFPDPLPDEEEIPF